MKLAPITLSCILYLHHKLWLKTLSFVAAKISTSQMYQLFSDNLLWDKYQYLLWQSYSPYGRCRLKHIISVFKCKHHYRPCVLRQIDNTLDSKISLPMGEFYMFCASHNYTKLFRYQIWVKFFSVNRRETIRRIYALLAS